MITLDNVEIYLTDYADGGLSPAQERELKAFLLLHPELEESLEDWKFAKLTPPVIRYPHKSQLKQMVSEGSIPGDAPRLIPDLTVRFENKAALYHKNTTVLFLRRLSAAAVLLLLICSANIYFYFQPPADFSVVDNIRIQKEEPLFPRQYMPSILHANVTCLPEKLALQRTLPDGKIPDIQTIARQAPVEITAVALPTVTVMTEKFPAIGMPDSPEILLTEQARNWKSSDENVRSRNIITSFIDAGKSLADKFRKEEYASR